MENALRQWYDFTCPEEWRDLALELRNFVFQKDPNFSEELKWKVPFFSCHGGACYFNPKKGEFQVGFMKGFRMSDPAKKLGSTGLKMIRHCIFTHEKQPWSDLEFFLDQAIYLNSWDKNHRV